MYYSCDAASSSEVDGGGEGDAVANIDGGRMGQQDGTTGETNKRAVTISFDYELTTSSPPDDNILASFAEGMPTSDLADRFGLLVDCADDRRRGRKGRRRGTVEVGHHHDDDGSIQQEDNDVNEADFDHDNDDKEEKVGGGSSDSKDARRGGSCWRYLEDETARRTNGWVAKVQSCGEDGSGGKRARAT